MSENPTPHLLPPAVRPKLLIVEDDAAIRTQMKWALAQDYEAFFAEDRKTAMQLLSREQPAVVTLDLGLPPRAQEVEEGFRTLAEMLEQDALLKVIVMTGQTAKEHALQAIGQGAYDFHCKPIQADEIRVILQRAFHISQLEREHHELNRRLRGEPFEGMLGTSPQMQEVFTAIRKVAVSESPVLIMGESGTGKELVARSIHRQSARNKGPFVAINCGAIPETLLESELFGHERGAFTGAHMQRKGRIETAQGGTLLLDEIGELPLPLQVKLLRFLQEHQIEWVGGREGIAVDVRVIAATNTDLQRAMAEGPNVTPADLELASPNARHEGRRLWEAREALERDLVQRALARNKGKVTQAAADLGVSRPTLYELMEKLGIARRQPEESKGS